LHLTHLAGHQSHCINQLADLVVSLNQHVGVFCDGLSMVQLHADHLLFVSRNIGHGWEWWVWWVHGWVWWVQWRKWACVRGVDLQDPEPFRVVMEAHLFRGHQILLQGPGSRIFVPMVEVHECDVEYMSSVSVFFLEVYLFDATNVFHMERVGDEGPGGILVGSLIESIVPRKRPSVAPLNENGLDLVRTS